MKTDRRYRTFSESHYKKFEGDENIIVGSAELIAVTTDRGMAWLTLCNTPIFNKQDAIKYATRLDDLIQFNRVRVATERNRFK